MSADPLPRLAALTLLALLVPAFPRAEPIGPDAFLATAARRAASLQTADRRCEPPTVDRSGRVSMDGSAAAVSPRDFGITGGLGRPLLLVTSDEDRPARGRPEAGTLRAAVEAAARDGGWIVFDEGLTGRTIHLSASLRLPSNTTLDGGCRGITLTAAPRTTSLRIANAENVVVRGLGFTKLPYSEPDEPTGDAIGLAERFDRIAVVNNDFTQCGDGCLDVIASRPGASMRVLVALNHFARHNKVMLVGSLVCSGERRPSACDAPLDHLGDAFAPSLNLTLFANVFEDTSQRHPKVVTGAFVHSILNLLVLRATEYRDGRHSAMYGAAAASGGLLLSDGDVIVNRTRPERVGVGPVSATRGTSGAAREADGAVAARGVVSIGAIRTVQHRPDLVVGRPGIPAWTSSRPEPLQLAACLLRVAGRRGLGTGYPVSCSFIRFAAAIGD